MTFDDRMEVPGPMPLEVAPGVFEVDFDAYDPPKPPSMIWDPETNCGSPFGPVLDVLPSKSPLPGVRPRWTVLKNETWKLYNALSFLTWQSGLCFNASITLTAGALGFTNHAEFLRIMPDWHKEMNRCLFDGDEKERKRQAEGRTRNRISRRMGQRVSHPHYWIAVVEYARDQGLHAHVLCVVPRSVQAAFEEKTWEWWRKKSPGDVQPNGIAFPKRHPNGPQRQYGLQVRLFRYITKTTGEGLTAPDHEGKVWTARQIFRPDPNDCTPVIVKVPQLAQISHRLNRGAQRAAGFQSKFDLGNFDEVYSGWEIGARARREEERKTMTLLDSLQF
ncbi:hypothetical protein U0C82_06845 [Fulvimarina sp. 2208YS6-2-32]|uniref:Uncharacterized protein n=1 Tax=Fulvimarina uroteuthidis TaxID=3098149 RepID=A0ABU5I3W6_9HYPH|nr:hypothetical protein [Fulvimarina sp. 2208YS6-2-32]MDY8108861.1 hypothetical protein [Fulvimarina sp. 2208YS6-2-32]